MINKIRISKNESKVTFILFLLFIVVASVFWSGFVKVCLVFGLVCPVTVYLISSFCIEFNLKLTLFRIISCYFIELNTAADSHQGSLAGRPCSSQTEIALVSEQTAGLVWMLIASPRHLVWFAFTHGLNQRLKWTKPLGQLQQLLQWSLIRKWTEAQSERHPWFLNLFVCFSGSGSNHSLSVIKIYFLFNSLVILFFNAQQN